MRLRDSILHPGTLTLLALAGVAVGGALFKSYLFYDRQGTDGLVIGVFMFASACLIGAVLRVGQERDRD